MVEERKEEGVLVEGAAAAPEAAGNRRGRRRGRTKKKETEMRREGAGYLYKRGGACLVFWN